MSDSEFERNLKDLVITKLLLEPNCKLEGL